MPTCTAHHACIAFSVRAAAAKLTLLQAPSSLVKAERLKQTSSILSYGAGENGSRGSAGGHYSSATARPCPPAQEESHGAFTSWAGE